MTPRPSREPWVLLLLAFSLECACAYLRLPLFPLVSGTMLWAVGTIELRGPIRLGLLAGAVGIASWALRGASTLELFIPLVLVGLALRRAGRPGFRWLLPMALLGWSFVAWALGGRLGSFPFEAIVAAATLRAPIGEWTAAVLARAILLSLSFALSLLLLPLSGTLTRGIERLRVCRHRSRVLAGVAIALILPPLVAKAGGRLASTFRASPSPERSALGTGEFLDLAPTRIETPAHIVLPKEARTSAMCLGCHGAKILSPDAGLAQIGLHEIHVRRVTPPLECSTCHREAGEPGFPFDSVRDDRRTAYNRACPTCHTAQDGGADAATLFWGRRFR